MKKNIAVANPKAEYQLLKNEILGAIENVLDNGHYILGGEVKKFESEFAGYLGVRYCTGVASGTDALILALKALNVVPGDEIITVSHTAVATVAAIELCGAAPVFCDIEPVSRCIDPEKIKGLIGKKTKAIIPVHIYGHPANMAEICKIAEDEGIGVIEDCSQAHGAEINGVKVGNFGHIGTYSFYPTKNLGTYGDGGAVVTNSEELHERINLLRQYGWAERYISSVQGMNSRLDEIQAAILNVKLKYLDQNIKKRRSIAEKYSKAINIPGIKLPEEVPGYLHAYHLYVIETGERDKLAEYLSSKNISTALHYPKAVHQQPAYERRLKGYDQLQETERLYNGILTLPLFAELSDEEVNTICQAFMEWSN